MERGKLYAAITLLSENHCSVKLPPDDVAQIATLVAGKTSDSILSIRSTEEGAVQVRTGFIHGPLFGGGNFYEFEKRDGKWHLVSEGSWVS